MNFLTVLVKLNNISRKGLNRIKSFAKAILYIIFWFYETKLIYKNRLSRDPYNQTLFIKNNMSNLLKINGSAGLSNHEKVNI